MSKYTPATALAIKRDVQKAQQMLSFILAEIEERNSELRSLDAVLDEKRGLVSRFEDMVAGVFSRGYAKVQAREKRVLALQGAISQLETARDLLEAEINLRKEEIVEPAGAVLVQSLIAELEPILDKLLTNIDHSEKYLESLKNKTAQFEDANKRLLSEAEAQEERVEQARFAAKEANEARTKALKELARENQTLSVIRQRERDSSAMSRRLSSEYQAVYNSTPRRNK